uniref:Uncharacterized protein n=1 Tax=Triticum urartu TaxID=4572 RepID=A0A8R7QWP4_TRIUA
MVGSFLSDLTYSSPLPYRFSFFLIRLLSPIYFLSYMSDYTIYPNYSLNSLNTHSFTSRKVNTLRTSTVHVDDEFLAAVGTAFLGHHCVLEDVNEGSFAVGQFTPTVRRSGHPE